MGRPFTILLDKLQRKGIEEAGFTNIHEVDRKVPMGGWPLDPKLAEVGRFVQFGFENDLEGEQELHAQRHADERSGALMTPIAGCSTLVWNTVLGWPADEYQVFLMNTRKQLRNPNIHPYFWIRTLYGRKPI